VERAILVAAPLQSATRAEVEEHQAELERLVDTAGAEVVGSMVQRIGAPHPSLYIGTGKTDELRGLVERCGASLVVFDEDLSPKQGTGLERRLGVRVMDRAELILDIFALRARTAEAKLQVELAQLQYLRPRLKRMWTHLSRTQGGIGMRGPGEQQIETDRRMIDRRIARLRRELLQIAHSRKTQRKARRGEFRVSLVGYTNAGKSSLLRSLSGSEVFVQDQLFATLDSLTREVDLGDGYRALITDTVGFIRKLPHHLVASFRASLEEIGDADRLLHVIDASAPDWRRQVEVVDQVLADLDVSGDSTILVFHKIDQLTHAEEAALRERAESLLGEHVLTSVREPGGVEALRAGLRAQARALRPTVCIRFPAEDGRMLAEAYREAEVIDRQQRGGEIILTARAPEALLGRWRRQPGVRVSRQDAA